MRRKKCTHTHKTTTHAHNLTHKWKKIHNAVNKCIKWQQTWNEEIAKCIASSSSHHVCSTPCALYVPDPAPCACGGSWEGSNSWTHSNEHQSVQCKHLSRMALVSWVGIAQWLEHRSYDWKVAGSNPCWSGGRIFFSRVNFLCWLLFRYPFHPCVTAVARKRPRSSCQKRRWQVTAKHAYTLRMWLCMKWHGAWLYGVHRTHRDWLSLAAASCGTSHASAVSTPLLWIFKNAL